MLKKQTKYRLSQSESDIQNIICEYLAYKNYFFWRCNNTGLYDPNKKIFRKLHKWGKSGVPDILLVKNGILYGLEVKRLKTHQSASQAQFQKDLEKAGGKYFVVRSVENVQNLGL